MKAGEKAQDAPMVAARDPQQDLCALLESTGESDDKVAARRLVSSMERPWEQLPSRLKSSIRFDASVIIEASGGIEELVIAGYGRRIAEFILRDLGKRG